MRYRSFLYEAHGELNKAIDFHEQALALDPLFASSHSYLAFLLYSAGAYKKAEAATQRALELNPQKTHDHFIADEDASTGVAPFMKTPLNNIGFE